VETAGACYSTQKLKFGEETKTVFFIPKNYGTVLNCTTLCSIIALAKKCGYGISASDEEKSLDDPLLANMRIGAYLSGFATIATSGTTGEYLSQDNFWSLGGRTAQYMAIRKLLKNIQHLRPEGLSFGKFITKELPTIANTNWKDVTYLGTLLQSAAESLTVTRLETYLRSVGDLQQRVIRKSWPWDNKGIFTTHEISWFNEKSKDVRNKYTVFLSNFKNPSHQLVVEFWTVYGDIMKDAAILIETANRAITLRQNIFFSSTKKRKKTVLANEQHTLLDDKQLIKVFHPKQLDPNLTAVASAKALSDPVQFKAFLDALMTKAGADDTAKALVTGFGDMLLEHCDNQIDGFTAQFEAICLKDASALGASAPPAADMAVDNN